MSNNKISKINTMFDLITKEFVNKDTKSGGVILGVYSEELGGCFHAAQGDLATVAALLAEIVERTAKHSDMTPHTLLRLIDTVIAEHNSDSEEEKK